MMKDDNEDDLKNKEDLHIGGRHTALDIFRFVVFFKHNLTVAVSVYLGVNRKNTKLTSQLKRHERKQHVNSCTNLFQIGLLRSNSHQQVIHGLQNYNTINVGKKVKV